ncbi:hypothetical protein PMI30_00438 [Pseudomonas sp. GM50]|uniref:hypothetical protein n=1 Tax=Pseudomonas sp. GM50 TaxID=1144332 RepID=UPI000270804E|nr:hypothetical protein [Pseudomonas sp. GM50]EJM71120.1 hypothetical protein PMI30_00438 [Pseudomonas sp. GM50]
MAAPIQTSPEYFFWGLVTHKNVLRMGDSRAIRARAITEGRNIPVAAFVAQYLAARRNVIELRGCYDEQFFVDLIIKHTDGTAVFFEDAHSRDR